MRLITISKGERKGNREIIRSLGIPETDCAEQAARESVSAFWDGDFETITRKLGISDFVIPE